jgi:hypothetical protein
VRNKNLASEKTVKLITSIFWVIWLALLAVFIFVEIFNDSPPYSRSVQVENLNVCNIHYSEDGTPESVSICGFIINREPGTIVDLSINLYQLPSENFISTVQDLSLNDKTGHFRVEIQLFREVIGSLEFYINK